MKEKKGKFKIFLGTFLSNSIYTEMNSKIEFSAAPKQRNSSILNDLILLILGHLRSANFDSFRVAQNQFLNSFRYKHP